MGMIGNTLAQGLISGANIQDGTVDTPDLKDSAVTAAKIASAVVTPAKMDFSAGTANGIAYLNGSKVLTTGSALTFDGTNLGVGTSSPSAKLHLKAATDASCIQLWETQGTTNQQWKWFVSGGAGGGNFIMQDATASANRLTMDTSGNLGLGVTPSAWYGNMKAVQFSDTASYISSYTSGITTYQHMFLGNNGYMDASGNWIYSKSRPAAQYYQQDNTHKWLIAASGTAGGTITFTQAMTLDNSGNLVIGGTTAGRALTVYGSSLAAFQLTNSTAGTGAGNGLEIYQEDANATIANQESGFLRFNTAATERARINSSGYFKASNSGSYLNSTGSFHELRGDGANSYELIVTNTNASPASQYVQDIRFSGASPNNTSARFLSCNDTTNEKAAIYSSGTFGSRTSTYGGISDAKLKDVVGNASSQWNDIKALRFRKYRFKDDPTGLLQLGLISQEAELVSPGLVFETPDKTTDEEGNRVETGEVTKHIKYSIVYMKAVVALQEAMLRIEEQQAIIESMAQRITALEAN